MVTFRAATAAGFSASALAAVVAVEGPEATGLRNTRLAAMTRVVPSFGPFLSSPGWTGSDDSSAGR